MLVIKGTQKIKGILDLSDVGLQMKNGDEYSLSEMDFYKHCVQVAVKMGFVTYHQNDVPDPDADLTIQLRNTFDRTITVNAIDSDVRPGQVFGLPEDQLTTPDIQGALAKGMLEIVSSVRSSNPVVEEADVSVGDLFESQDQSQEEAVMSYSGPNASESDFLETNEEVNAPNVITDDNPPPVQAKDIDDPKGTTVVWNPNNDPIPQMKTGMDAISANDDNPLADSGDVDISEISFVDSELDAERRASHPVLKSKQSDNNDEIEFVG